MKRYIILLLILVTSAGLLGAQENYRPERFFREDWKDTPAEIPLNQKHVANPDLTVQLYGAGKDS